MKDKYPIIISVIIFILLAILAFISGRDFYQSRQNNEVINACGINDETCDTEENPRGENFSVKSLLSENVNVISFDESLTKIEEEKAVVLFYSFDDCPWCYDAWPVFYEVAKNYKDINFYYVNVSRDERVDGNETYDYLKELFNQEKIYIPFVAFVKDGQLGWYNVATVESHVVENDILPLINEEQKEELKNIYTEYFEDMQSVLDRER